MYRKRSPRGATRSGSSVGGWGRATHPRKSCSRTIGAAGHARTIKASRKAEALPSGMLQAVSAERNPSAFPSKRVGAGVLIRDDRGYVLLVKPTYKDGWEVPGGLVEEEESPREAARRECREELGVDVAVGRALCVHNAEGHRTSGDGLMLVFDGGTTSLLATEFRLPRDELERAEFVSPVELARHLPSTMAARIRAAVDAAVSGQIAYMER